MSEQEYNKSFFDDSWQHDDIEYRDDDWKKMEVLLDKEEKRKPLIYWFNLNKATLGIALVIILLGSIGIYSLISQSASKGIAKVDHRSTHNLAMTTTAKKNAKSNIDEINSISNPTQKNILEYPSNRNQNHVAQKEKQKKVLMNTTTFKAEKVDVNKTILFERKISNNQKRDEKENKENTIYKLPSSKNEATIDTQSSNMKVEFLTNTSSILNAEQIESLKEELKSDSITLATTLATQKDKHVERNKWQLGIVINPELNAPNISGSYASSIIAGANIRYHFAPKWYASIGVITGRKNYTGKGSEYNPPKGYWVRRTNGIIPDRVEGYCKMIELPIMIQYKLLGKQNDQLLTGIGISSYIMKAEAYTYQFKTPNPGAVGGWESSADDSYLFKVIRASFSYEHRFTPAISLAAEPYLQVPLQKIGWTNIKLTSIGNSFILRYHFKK